MRSTTAAPAPQSIACLRWRSGRDRAASAMTTALSPDRMRLTQTIVPSPNQNCAVRNSSIQRTLLPRRPAYPTSSEQPDHLPVDEVDFDRRWDLGQSRHGHDVAADHHDELGARREAHLAHIDHVIDRCSPQLRVGRERILGLRNAHRIVAVAVFLELLDLAAHLGVRGHLARAVDLLRDLVDLVPERIRLVVDELEVALLLAQVDDDASELRRALAA